MGKINQNNIIFIFLRSVTKLFRYDKVISTYFLSDFFFLQEIQWISYLICLRDEKWDINQIKFYSEKKTWRKK